MTKNRPETIFVGQNTIILDEIPSTNDWLMQRQDSLPEGTAVFTPCQIAGKGQYGSLWSSERNANFAASFLLKPSFLSGNTLYTLNMAVALAAAETLPIPTWIKWPNDLYSQKNLRKVAGILIENVFQGSTLKSVVIGLGINVNQKLEENTDFRATSLFEQDGQSREPHSLLFPFCENLEKRYLQIRQGEIARLETEYEQKMLGLHQPRSFRAGDEKFIGIIQGVATDGTLQVRIGDETKSFRNKEIEWLWEI